MRRGNCYATSEALYHLLGGKKAGWKPMHVRINPDDEECHWFLARVKNEYLASNREFPQGWEILDLTKSQFGGKPVPYHKAVGSGFLTKEPSLRARNLMDILVYQS